MSVKKVCQETLDNKEVCKDRGVDGGGLQLIDKVHINNGFGTHKIAVDFR
jgi:hypothetical protein